MKMQEGIAEINTKKYPCPPSYDKIREFITEMGVSNHHFERFFGIPFNIIAQIKLGTKRLPPQYWHFVYEKIVPAIGPGYLKSIESKSVTKTITKRITSPSVTHIPDNSQNSHDRIGDLI